MSGNGWHNWCLGTNTEMLSGESGLESVLNLVHISILPAERQFIEGSGAALAWNQLLVGLFTGCFLCELCFLFPSLWPEWCSAISHTQVQHPAARVCARRGRTAQHWAAYVQEGSRIPLGCLCPLKGLCTCPPQRHLTLHPVPSCRLGLQQAPAELLWHNLPALKAATASASFDPYVLGMFSAGQNWKYGKLLVLKRWQ